MTKKSNTSRLYHIAGNTIFTISLILLSLIFFIKYFFFPRLDDYKDLISQELTNAIGLELKISEISGSLKGLSPEIEFSKIMITDEENKIKFSLDKIVANISISSIFKKNLIFSSFFVSGINLNLKRDKDNSLLIENIALFKKSKSLNPKFQDWLLKQREIILTDLIVDFRDDLGILPKTKFVNSNFRLLINENNIKFGFKSFLDNNPENNFFSSGDFYINEQSLINGDFFADFRNVNPDIFNNLSHDKKISITGKLDFKKWISFSNSKVDDVIILPKINNLSILSENEIIFDFEKLSGKILLSFDKSKISVFGSNIVLKNHGMKGSDPIRFYLKNTINDEENYYDFYISKLKTDNLDKIEKILSPYKNKNYLQNDYRVSGYVSDVLAKLSFDKKNLNINKIKFNFRNLFIKDKTLNYDIKNLTGNIFFDKNTFILDLDSKDLFIKYPNEYTHNELNASKLACKIIFSNQLKNNYLRINNLELDSNDFDLTLNGKINLGDSNKNYSNIKGKFNNIRAKNLWKYWLNGTRTKIWLKKSIKQGTYHDIDFFLSGYLNKFPFKTKEDGELNVSGKFKDLIADYSPSWPILDSAKGKFTLKNRILKTFFSNASVNDIKFNESEVIITKVGSKSEELKILANGDGELGKTFGLIGNNFGDLLNNFSIKEVSGRTISKFQLRKPLFKKSDLEIDGEIESKNAKLKIIKNLPIEKFNFKLNFNEDVITDFKGDGFILGNPINLLYENLYQTKSDFNDSFLKLNGTLETRKLLPILSSNFLNKVPGKTLWTGRVSKSSKGFRLEVFSNLNGISFLFPSPINKNAEKKQDLKLTFDINKDKVIIYSKLDKFNLVAKLIKDQDLSAGIGIGVNAKLPKKGIQINANLLHLDLDEWDNYFSSNISKNKLNVPISNISLNTKSLIYKNNVFSNFSLTALNNLGIWKGDVDSDELSGRFSFNKKKSLIQTSLAKLNIKNFKPKKNDDIFSSDSYHNINAKIENLTLKGVNLGNSEIKSHSFKEKWILEKFTSSTKGGELYMYGSATYGKNTETNLSIESSIDDLGYILNKSGLSNGIKDGKGNLEGFIKWQGPPSNFNLDNLGGKLNVKVSDGRFLKLEPGAARLLGILSLQALPKRLTLDFRDVFSSGFTFKSIDSIFSLDNGIAKTNNFSMEGPSARVLMAGEIDLNNEKQDLIIKIFPQLSTAAAVAGAAVVNPAVGVATLFLQKIFGDPVEELASRKYHISGSWDKPETKRIYSEKSLQ